MKKISLFLCLALISFSLLAQRKENKPGYDREKLSAAKIAFITQKLDITPDQAEQFWPLYNAFEDKRRNLLHQLRVISHLDQENLTEEKATQLIQNKIDLQQSLLDLEKSSLNKFTEVLRPKQVYLLQEADRDFVKHLYRVNRKRKTERPKR